MDVVTSHSEATSRANRWASTMEGFSPAGAVVLLPGPIHNWAFKTVPQKGLDMRQGYQPRGKGLGGFVAPAFRFAWPVLLVIGVLTLLVSPWAAQQTQDMKDRFEKRGDLERVQPGQFAQNLLGALVGNVRHDHLHFHELVAAHFAGRIP